jgi:hypothetical protein
VQHRVRPLSASGTSVKQDWHAWLPADKSKVFYASIQQLESTYYMMSISLNEAMELRRSGRLLKASQAMGVVPALCSRFAVQLETLLRALSDHAKHYGTVPNTAPLDPVNYRSRCGQHASRRSGLLSHVLFSGKTQFLSKLSTLQEMVEDLGQEFGEAAKDLSCEVCAGPDMLWTVLDENHFDLNTCMREAIVLFKSFLRVLPDDQLADFQKAIVPQEIPAPAPVPPSSAPRDQRRNDQRRIEQSAGK